MLLQTNYTLLFLPDALHLKHKNRLGYNEMMAFPRRIMPFLKYWVTITSWFPITADIRFPRGGVTCPTLHSTRFFQLVFGMNKKIPKLSKVVNF